MCSLSLEKLTSLRKHTLGSANFPPPQSAKISAKSSAKCLLSLDCPTPSAPLMTRVLRSCSASILSSILGVMRYRVTKTSLV